MDVDFMMDLYAHPMCTVVHLATDRGAMQVFTCPPRRVIADSKPAATICKQSIRKNGANKQPKEPKQPKQQPNKPKQQPKQPKQPKEPKEPRRQFRMRHLRPTMQTSSKAR